MKTLIDDIKRKHMRELLQEFNEAAQQHGWARDQGGQTSATLSLDRYNIAVARLVNYINRVLK